MRALDCAPPCGLLGSTDRWCLSGPTFHPALDSTDSVVTARSYTGEGKTAQGINRQSPSLHRVTIGSRLCTTTSRHDIGHRSALLSPLLADAIVAKQTCCCAYRPPAKYSLAKPGVEDCGLARCPSEVASQAELLMLGRSAGLHARQIRISGSQDRSQVPPLETRALSTRPPSH